MKATPEQRQILSALDALASTMDAEYIERRMAEAGYFKASDDERTKKASLVAIVNADELEGKPYESGKYAFQFTLYYNVKGFEKYEFAWLHVVKNNGKGVGLPFIERIYAREIKLL